MCDDILLSRLAEATEECILDLRQRVRVFTDRLATSKTSNELLDTLDILNGSLQGAVSRIEELELLLVARKTGGM